MTIRQSMLHLNAENLMRPVALATILACASLASAATPPPLPPEVKQTVDAFVGKWVMDAAIAMPGAGARTKFKMSLDCKKIALGNGVQCTMSGKISDLGPLEQTCLVGHDPQSGTGTHMMCITSMGEVHDHKGTWKDDKSLVFEPFKFTSAGKTATEDVSVTWPDTKSLVFTSVVTMEDGSRTTFEATGKRK